MTNRRHLGLLALIAWLVAAPAGAQYFGQNKVQYRQFAFKVLETDHFDIYYYPEEAASVQIAARMAERWYARLSKVLDHELSSRQPLILYASHADFEQTNTLEGEIGEGTGGVTESLKRRMILPFAGGLAETDHVLGHEMVHAFQYDIGNKRDKEGNVTGPGVELLPLWFIEGMAEYLSLGPVDALTAMWIRDAASRDKMPSVDQLSDPDFFPYRYGQAFWAYVAGRWGDTAIGDMLRASGPRGDLEGAMKSVLGVDKKTFTTDWHAATQRTYAPFFETTRPPSRYGRQIISEKMNGGKLNVGPAISPDGKRVVFLSERSLFSIDMYLADVATGHVVRKLVETAGDPHFDSLQFIESAGDWAPDNRRFTFAGQSKGRPVLDILDVETGQRLSEHQFDTLDQVLNPAWSPDGQRIAFSAMHGGVLDLYVYDLQAKTLVQLTDDAFADYDPEWSPDGQRLAWVTDRFTTNLTTLEYGTYKIGLMDLTTRQVRTGAGFDAGRNTNPEFSEDGRSIYFIGTPDGIANIYRTELGGTTVKVTDVLSGVSGITALSPAFSVAAAAPEMVFTIFQDNKYSIYATENPARLAASVEPATDRNGAILPPYPRKPEQVTTYLDSPQIGLPPATVDYPSTPYKAKLSLDMVGQPAIGFGADRFGYYGGGGVSFLWSDVLGNHQLGTMVQVTNRIEETGAVVQYLDRTHRWNWGLVGERTPYVTGSFTQGYADVNDQTVFVQQEYRVTQTNNAASVLTQYPLSRAQRVEFSAGARRIGFSRKVQTDYYDPITGGFLDRTKENLPALDAINLAEASAALVWDSSLFGATSPILGQRYRFEFTQESGNLTYSGVLADYRRYFMPVRPFTIAVRGLHYGRYGGSGEDQRLSPLYLGYPGLVRGYDVNSFNGSECGNSPNGSCPVFDRIVGSRMLVTNLELRFPLVGLFSRRSFYGPVPIELALFGDAGLAWTSADDPTFAGGDRPWVRSVGVTARVNVLGFAVAEFDYVRPLDRPGRGWLWQFNLIPGF